MERRVVITGIGWITPLGHDIETVWQRLIAGQSGIAPTTIFEASTFPTSFAGEVRSFSLEAFLGAKAAKHGDANRNAQFALAAATQAWESAGLTNYMGLDSTQVGVYLGGGEGPLHFDPFAAAATKGCLNDQGQVGPLDRPLGRLGPHHQLCQQYPVERLCSGP